MIHGWRGVAGAAFLAAVTAGAAAQDTQEDLRGTIEALKRQLQAQEQRLAELEALQSDERLRQLQRQAVLDVLKEMNADAAARPALPKWMENLTLHGDLRLRYEGACWSDEDPSAKKNRNRARVRLRLGLTKTWEDWEVGLRLATGEPETVSGVPTGYSDATSANQSFTGLFSQKPFWVDLAYVKYRPGGLKGLELTGGKMKNPFYATETLWDNNVNPEGFHGRYRVPGLGPVEPFAGAGYFVAREMNQSADNAYDTVLMTYEAGTVWKLAKDVAYTFAATYYDWDHYDTSGAIARGNDPNWRRGAGGPVDWNFAVIDLYNRLDFRVMNLPVAACFEWIHNCADDDSNMENCSRDGAMTACLQVGQNKKAGDWSVSYRYAYVEANALPGHFADATFGGSNRKGHVFGGDYNITDFLQLGLRLYLTQPVRSTDATDDQAVVQADLVWRF